MVEYLKLSLLTKCLRPKSGYNCAHCVRKQPKSTFPPSIEDGGGCGAHGVRGSGWGCKGRAHPRKRAGGHAILGPNPLRKPEGGEVVDSKGWREPPAKRGGCGEMKGGHSPSLREGKGGT